MKKENLHGNCRDTAIGWKGASSKIGVGWGGLQKEKGKRIREWPGGGKD